MQWTADTIVSLRRAAGLTQAQLAGWLGVTIKQVKHLEHQRRNPSGPVTRLLDMLQARLNRTQHPRENNLVQMISSSTRGETVPPRVGATGDAGAARPEPSARGPSVTANVPEGDGAFVWNS